MRIQLSLFCSFILCLSLHSQSLDFLGMKDIHFGMKLEQLEGHRLILDSTSSYTDTATYLKNTRCQMYGRANENLNLNGFTASEIEYEFCDFELGYVFINVNGKEEIDRALAALKIQFPKMNCGSKVPLGSCALIDCHNSKLRLIVRIDQTKQEMHFVLIPKKAAK